MTISTSFVSTRPTPPFVILKSIFPTWRIDATMANRSFCSSVLKSITFKASFTTWKPPRSVKFFMIAVSAYNHVKEIQYCTHILKTTIFMYNYFTKCITIVVSAHTCTLCMKAVWQCIKMIIDHGNIFLSYQNYLGIIFILYYMKNIFARQHENIKNTLGSNICK